MSFSRLAQRATYMASRQTLLSSRLIKPSSASCAASLRLSRSYYETSPEPFHFIPNRFPVVCSADEAVKCIQSNDRVFIHGAAATPRVLLQALARRGKADNSIRNIELVSIHTEGPAEYAADDLADVFRPNLLFIGANLRSAVNTGRADFTPMFLRDIPKLFRTGQMPINVALISVSEPDEHGFCTLGPSVDITRAALQSAKTIVAFVNKQLPRTYGDGIIHMSHFNYMVQGDVPLPTHEVSELDDSDRAIGQFISQNLVRDGATLQLGIGKIPDAVLSGLSHHKDLGIHTEMCSDGAMNLVAQGVVTNAKKKLHPGKIITSFANGSRTFFNWIDNNPSINFLDVAYVNNPAVIAQNPRVTSINSCIEIDISGQVVSSTIGRRQFSGVGGQLDFVLGALMCPEGQAILALPSVTSKGESRIVPVIHEGAAVTTSREHVMYVVTEYGIAELFGKTLLQRGRELVKIAHPNHRESLEKELIRRYGSK